MNASDKLNQISKIKRSQATKDRFAYGNALGQCSPDLDEAERALRIGFQVKANKLQYCGSWLYLREFLETGESKVLNSLLCKLSFLCEVCAVRRQAKQFAASMNKVQQVMNQRPDLIPVMITRTIKSGPDLKFQADHFRKSREKMLATIRKFKSAKCRNARDYEMGKVLGQIRSYEVKRSAGNSDHWNFHEHCFGLIVDYIQVPKMQTEWLEVTGDSFIVDVRKIYAKEGCTDADPVGSALAEVLKYPLKFAGLMPADAWHAHEVLSGSQMTSCLGLLRGVKTGSIESDEPLDDETGPFRDFVANWSESRQFYHVEEVRQFRP